MSKDVAALAAEAYNLAWELMDLDERTPEEEADMLAAAFAQRYHWYAIGKDHHKATGDWQVARALSIAGEGALAIRFAQLAVTRAQTGDGPDFLQASCFEGLARAHAAAGNNEERDRWLERARGALDRIADDDDRELIESQIESVP